MDRGGGEGGESGEGPVVRVEDMKCALREVRPSAMREVVVEVPKVSFLRMLSLQRILYNMAVGTVGRHWRTSRCEAKTQRSC